ncbi:MAG: hypothetical protein P1U41_02485 [Vicingaceae bacterium]|nr:hypothetical protein [Vicingaceae bacterium]
MKKTISTIFAALLIAGVSSVNAQDTKVKTKKVATAAAKEVKPKVNSAGVVEKKVAKIDPAIPPADATQTKKTSTGTVNVKAKKVTKAKATINAQPIAEPKKSKTNAPQ